MCPFTAVFAMFIDFFSLELSSRFDTLSKTHRVLESQLQNAKHIAHSLLPTMPTIPATADEGEVAEAFAEHEAGIWWHKRQFEIELPRFIRNSFLLRLYSLFEWAANGMANQISERKNLNHRLNLKAPLTDRIVTFLKNPGVMAVQFDVAGAIEAVDDLRVVRNCLVHCAGDPSRIDKQRDRQLLESILYRGVGVSRLGKSPLIDDDESGLLWVDESYCFHAHTGVYTFFKNAMIAASCFS